MDAADRLVPTQAGDADNAVRARVIFGSLYEQLAPSLEGLRVRPSLALSAGNGTGTARLVEQNRLGWRSYGSKVSGLLATCPGVETFVVYSRTSIFLNF